jgi:hypothetical protein
MASWSYACFYSLIRFAIIPSFLNMIPEPYSLYFSGKISRFMGRVEEASSHHQPEVIVMEWGGLARKTNLSYSITDEQIEKKRLAQAPENRPQVEGKKARPGEDGKNALGANTILRT